MLRDYICEECGHTQEVWRQLSENMPKSVECKVWFMHDPPYGLSGEGHNCLGRAYVDHRLYPTKTVYKGGGWTPGSHSGEAVLDVPIEGDSE